MAVLQTPPAPPSSVGGRLPHPVDIVAPGPSFEIMPAPTGPQWIIDTSHPDMPLLPTAPLHQGYSPPYAPTHGDPVQTPGGPLPPSIPLGPYAGRQPPVAPQPPDQGQPKQPVMPPPVTGLPPGIDTALSAVPPTVQALLESLFPGLAGHGSPGPFPVVSFGYQGQNRRRMEGVTHHRQIVRPPWPGAPSFAELRADTEPVGGSGGS